MTAARPETGQPERGDVDRRIAQIRKQMDEVDARLVSLLNERATYARKIGTLKDTMGLDVYQPEREIEVLKHVRSKNLGPLGEDAVTRLFERIIDETRRLERSVSQESRPAID